MKRVKEYDLNVAGRGMVVLIVATSKAEAMEMAKLWIKEKSISVYWDITIPKFNMYSKYEKRVRLYEKELEYFHLEDKRK